MNEMHFDLLGGEDATLAMAGRTFLQEPFDLTGAAISFRMQKSSRGGVIEKSGTITDAAGGTFSVPIAATDTETLDGLFPYQVTALVGGLKSAVCAGFIRIRTKI